MSQNKILKILKSCQTNVCDYLNIGDFCKSLISLSGQSNSRGSLIHRQAEAYRTHELARQAEAYRTHLVNGPYRESAGEVPFPGLSGVQSPQRVIIEASAVWNDTILLDLARAM